MRRGLLTTAAAAVLSVTVPATSLGSVPGSPPRFPLIAPYCSRADYQSGTSRVRAALCLPQASSSGRVAVIVSGCGGFGALDQVLARDLPLMGIATYYIDLFARTPKPDPRKGFCGNQSALQRALPTWQQEIADAQRSLVRGNGFAPAGIGAVGWSLGGVLCLLSGESGIRAHTGPPGHIFGAIVSVSGGAQPAVLQDARALPPTLVLVGGKENPRSVSDARSVYESALRNRVPAELHVYKDGDHRWRGAARTAAERWITAFLDRHLRG